MQSVAKWLLVRPLNSIMAMAAILLLPYINLLSGVIVVLLVLEQGEGPAAAKLLIAAALLSVFALVVDAPAVRVLITALVLTVPALLFATVLLRTRSFTLTMQISVIVAAIAVSLFYAFVGDAVAFWEPFVAELVAAWREMGLEQQFKPLLEDPERMAGSITTAAAVSFWITLVGMLLAGYWLYKQLPGERKSFGRIRDLDFGRVIAIVTAVTSLLAFGVGTLWSESVAYLFFVAFWLQGLALVHWLYSDGPLPLFAVIATYAAIVVLHIYMLTALAVLGYTDAWFQYRRRVVKQQSS